MNRNIFISHSNKFLELAEYFAQFLKCRGLIPIVVEFMPNAGRLWSVEQKVTHFVEKCDSAIVIATPDEKQGDRPVPRTDVILEIGRLKEKGKKIVILKESSTALPTGLDVVYVPFDMSDPSTCLKQLDDELTSIFGDAISQKTTFAKNPPRRRVRPAYVLEGKALVPERPDLIRKEVLGIFLRESKTEQTRIFADVVALLDNGTEDVRWVAGLLLEEILEYDVSLVPRHAILKMSTDPSFSVRSCAAVCLFVLANIAPSLVPLDIVMRLASMNEDWYVFTPALATLKTLAHNMPRAFDAILRMACSGAKDEVEYGVSALLDIVENDPDVMGEESLNILRKSPSKQAQETVVRITAILKTAERRPPVIRYSPF